MMSAPNLLGVLERIVRYVRIVNDAALVTVKRDSEGFRLTLQISTGQQPMPWQRFGFDLMAFLSFCRWVTTSDLRPIALELAFAPSADLEPYEDAFKCPVRFNAVANALLFSPSDVRLPLPTAHHVLAEIHERIAAEHLQQVDSSPTRRHVHAVLTRCLSDGDPTRAKVAKAMALSERTLQRRLKAEGTSFQHVLDDTRRELAERYMTRSDLSLADIAYLLGFDDKSSLFRASKRWFGTSPGHRRARSHRQRIVLDSNSNLDSDSDFRLRTRRETTASGITARSLFVASSGMSSDSLRRRLRASTLSQVRMIGLEQHERLQVPIP